MSNDEQEVLSIDEVAKMLKIPKATAYKFAGQGEIPGTKVGRKWVFLRTRILAWLDKKTQAVAG
ncbi:MAG: helix-turn-helix domain-containing protein [Nitrospirales bacterium]|nr:helix-turn-helix domain-containing protein [Nitrospirales bacterium]